MPFCSRARGRRLRSQRPGLAAGPGESGGRSPPRPGCLSPPPPGAGPVGASPGKRRLGVCGAGGGGRRRCLPRAPGAAGEEPAGGPRRAASGRAGSELRRTGNPARAAACVCAAGRERSGAPAAAQPSLPHATGPSHV